MSHEYHAEVVRWIDGDTVVLDFDLGFRVGIVEHIRLIGYDAPERGKPGFTEARNRALELCPVGSTVWVATHKTHARSFARWVGHVYPSEGAPSVAETLTAERLTKADFA